MTIELTREILDNHPLTLPTMIPTLLKPSHAFEDCDSFPFSKPHIEKVQKTCEASRTLNYGSPTTLSQHSFFWPNSEPELFPFRHYIANFASFSPLLIASKEDCVGVICAI